MRNKVAKKLRKDAQQLAQGQAWESYETLGQHYKMVFNPLTIKMEPCIVYTQMLGACGKAVYKNIKQKYKAGQLKKVV